HGGEPALLLLLAPPAPDGEHRERALHRGHRAQPRVARLELLHDEPVGDVGEPGAAVALQVRAEEAELGHARDERARELLLRVAALDPGQHLALDEAPHARPRHALLLAEELLQPVVVDLARGHLDPLAAPGVARPRAGPYKLVSRSTDRRISVHL